MITAEVNTILPATLVSSRKTLSDFKSVRLDLGFTDFVWTFSFTLAGNGATPPPVKIGDDIKFSADGKLVLSGYIEKIDTAYGKNRHDLLVSGRSFTADLVDSTIDGGVHYDAQINLATIAESLIDNLFADPLTPAEIESATRPEIKIGVVVEDSINDFLLSEGLGAEVGQTYFEVLEKFARKRQTILTTNERGEVVFARGHGDQSTPLRLQNKIGDATNNVKSAMSSEDRSKMFNLYSINSQPSRGGFWQIDELSEDDLFNTEGRTIDRTIRVSRKFFMVAENGSYRDQCDDRAQWEAVIKRSQSLKYSATVEGHSYKGETWFPNKSVGVVDEFAGHNGRMLVDKVSLTQSVSGGSTSNIVCVSANSYNFLEKDIAGELAKDYADIPLGPF
jgi:prophage tail gpP-like protein